MNSFFSRVYMSARHPYLAEGKITFLTPFRINEFVSLMEYITDKIPCGSRYRINFEVTHPSDESENVSDCLGRFYRQDRSETEFFNIEFTNKGRISAIKFFSYNSHLKKYIDTGEPSELLKLVCEKAHEFLLL